MPISNNKFLLVLLIIGLAVRLSYVLARSQELKFDELDYDNLAWNISRGIGYINTERIPSGHLAARPPGYPIFLAGVYRVFGHNRTAVRIAQAIISTFLIILIYLIGKEVFNVSVGKLAAVFTAFYPFFIYYSGVLQSELLCALWLALAVLFASRLLEKPQRHNILLTGIFVGLAGLTRPVFILYGGFLLFAFLAHQRFRFMRAFKIWLLVLTVVILTFSPWVIRNYLRLGSFIPGTTWGGEALYASFHSTADGSPGPNLYDDEFVKIRNEIKDEVALDRYFTKKAMGFIVNNPRHYYWLIWKRFLKIWNILPNTTRFDQIASLFSFGTILPFFLIGLIRALRLNQAIMIAITVFYVSLVFPLLYYGSTRLRLPIDAFVLIFSASGVIFLSSRFGYRMDERMLKLYRGRGINTLFLRYRWWVFPHKIVASFVPKDGLIYDLGCGHGIFSNYLVMQSPLRRVVGIEYDPKRFKSALDTVKNKNNPVFRLGNIEKEEYETCEAFILLDVLHHCPSYQFQDELLKRCYENLKPGGRIIIVEVNNKPRLKYALCWFLDNIFNPCHGIYYRNKENMLRLLKSMNFSVETKRVDYKIPYTSMLYIAKKE